MPESLIERVAKAIGAELEKAGVYVTHLDAITRAALAAAREPTKAMFVRGGIAIEDSAFGEGNLIFGAAADCWRAMIDKALEEGK
jgi:hypothetical protein